MYEVRIEQKFSSAHYLRNYKGADEPLHGHNWKVRVEYRGQELVKPEEYLVDFVEAHDHLKKVLAPVSYANINAVPPFDRINPSAENLARWIWDEMKKLSPRFPPSRVTVWETDDGAASYIPG